MKNLKTPVFRLSHLVLVQPGKNKKGHSLMGTPFYLNGSPGWTRTNNPAINSRMLHH